MEKPQNYEAVEAAEEFRGFKTLELGGHICVIKKAYEYTNPEGNKSLKIELDIAEGKQKGFYQEQFDNNTNSDKKWPNGAVKYVTLKEDDKSVSFFKGFITTVVNSNPGYDWNWDESTLVGKKVVGVFGLEEYEDAGATKTTTKLRNLRSINKLSEVTIPSVKVINGKNAQGYATYEYVDYEEYINKPKTNEVESTFGDSVSLDDCDLD
jgi:hypothetical protein